MQNSSIRELILSWTFFTEQVTLNGSSTTAKRFCGCNPTSSSQQTLATILDYIIELSNIIANQWSDCQWYHLQNWNGEAEIIHLYYPPDFHWLHCHIHSSYKLNRMPIFCNRWYWCLKVYASTAALKWHICANV